MAMRTAMRRGMRTLCSLADGVVRAGSSLFQYIVLFFVPSRESGITPSVHQSGSDGRRNMMPKGLDVGEVSIVSAVVCYTFGLVCG